MLSQRFLSVPFILVLSSFFLCTAAAQSFLSNSQNSSFIYNNNFSAGGEVLCLGVSSIVVDDSSSSSFLSLIPSPANASIVNVSGRCVLSTPVKLWSSTGPATSFSTAFIFIINKNRDQAIGDGITFFLSPTPQESEGSVQGYIGLLNETSNGQNTSHTLAVEFDITQNTQFLDPDNNHVGIDIDSLQSVNTTAPESLAVKLHDQKIQAWIDYDGTTQEISVRISGTLGPKPVEPLVQFNLQGYDVLQQFMYIGFSASTGQYTAVHSVLAWSFNLNGPAPNIDLAAIRDKLRISLGFIAAVVIPVTIGAVGLLAILWYVRYLKTRIEIKQLPKGLDLELSVSEIAQGPRECTYKELELATKGFDNSLKLGEGGFGVVYRGVLIDGTEVAVKKISSKSKQGPEEFVAELKTIGRLTHKNLVTLYGWGRKRGTGELLLVYEYVVNGSLDDILFETSQNQHRVLSWKQRYNILSGVAAALLYLHEDSRVQEVVLHRDVKASNILLDAQFNPKLGDFGLAKSYDKLQAPETTIHVAGTPGYLAPELRHAAYTGKAKFTEKSDVYGFGAVGLELATGKKILDQNRQEYIDLVDWVWDRHHERRIMDSVDFRLKLEDPGERNQVAFVLLLSLLCCHPNPQDRPTMGQVLQYLRREKPLPLVPHEKPVPIFPTSSHPRLTEGSGWITQVSNSSNLTSIPESTLSKSDSSTSSYTGAPYSSPLVKTKSQILTTSKSDVSIRNKYTSHSSSSIETSSQPNTPRHYFTN